jgi:hypothetical protein
MEYPIIKDQWWNQAPVGIIHTGIIECHTEQENDDGGKDIQDQDHKDWMDDGYGIKNKPYHKSRYDIPKQAYDQTQCLIPFPIFHSVLEQKYDIFRKNTNLFQNPKLILRNSV